MQEMRWRRAGDYPSSDSLDTGKVQEPCREASKIHEFVAAQNKKTAAFERRQSLSSVDMGGSFCRVDLNCHSAAELPN